MNTNEVREIIAEVDQHLLQLTVSGENVFHVADARRLLKAAFDRVPPMPEEAVQEANAAPVMGGEVDG